MGSDNELGRHVITPTVRLFVKPKGHLLRGGEMADKYLYLTIWVTESNSVFKSSIFDYEKFVLNKVPWSKLLDRDFYRDILPYLGLDGWQLVSTSVPDEYAITRFIFCKKL